MHRDPNQSQGILSTNKHYYADTFSVVGFKYIKKPLEDILFAFADPIVCKKSCLFPQELGFPQPALTNK